MSQNANILNFLQLGHTLTKREAAIMGFGYSLNSRVAELRDKTGIQIDCWTENRNGKTVFVYGLPEKIAHG